MKDKIKIYCQDLHIFTIEREVLFSHCSFCRQYDLCIHLDIETEEDYIGKIAMCKNCLDKMKGELL